MSEDHLPPGPRHSLSWLRYLVDPYGVFRALARRYGDVVYIRLPGTPGTVATGHPEGVRAILAADATTLVPWRIDASAALLTDYSIFLQPGERHRATRRILTPMFQGAHVRQYGAVIERIAAAALDAQAEGVVTAHELAGRIALDVMLQICFGPQIHDRSSRFRSAAAGALNSPYFIYLKVLRRRFGGHGPWARALDKIASLRALVQVEIETRRAHGVIGEDVLGMAMRARHDDGSPLVDEEIQVRMIDIIMAGHETNAVTIAWACYELCRSRDIMARTVDEVDRAWDGPASLGALQYLSAVCHETLRLHPPNALLTRKVAKAITVCGWEIPPGYGVSMMLPVIHTRADIYPDPFVFRPERFLERTYAPCEYLPFGGGVKRCVGAALALDEMMIVVASLLRHFRIGLIRDRPVRHAPRSLTVAPAGGVELRLARRVPRDSRSSQELHGAGARSDGQ